MLTLGLQSYRRKQPDGDFTHLYPSSSQAINGLPMALAMTSIHSRVTALLPRLFLADAVLTAVRLHQAVILNLYCEIIH